MFFNFKCAPKSQKLSSNQILLLLFNWGSHYFIKYSFVLVQPQLKELCHHVSCVAFGIISCLVGHKFEKASYEIEEEKERKFCK